MLLYTVVSSERTHSSAGAPDDTVGALTTEAVVDRIVSADWAALPSAVRDATLRHVIDTVGVMIAGAWTSTTAAVAETAASAGDVPVPGRANTVTALDAGYLGGVAAHGLEFDDGYRAGSVHPGACVVPAALAVGYSAAATGPQLLAAVAAGYEAMAVIARHYHPPLRQRGFHPTGVTGVFGAAAASARLLGLDEGATAGAIGTAASSSAGLFAFLTGGGEVKRLHAGAAARNGMLAAFLAARGIAGPPRVLEARDGFGAAFSGGRAQPAASLASAMTWAVADCYLKPYPCCRHLHSAVDLLLDLRREHGIEPASIRAIRVDTYEIAAAHANVGWGDPAGAQLSFPFVLATAARHGGVALDDFRPARLSDPGTAALAGKVAVHADVELDHGYPAGRPARVTVTTTGGTYGATGSEARGSATAPLSDAEVAAKFAELTQPVLGADAADRLLGSLQGLAEAADIRPVVAAARPKAHGGPDRILW
jgi:2-methylcitrate dehydratase PrpD